ncbi:MAG: adenylate/guanylate cyclase domain-containing protein [Candidatus Omnitrophota bacterium]|nr:HAMP domain-containing protein [Candidatus Omnitrophota bacterium]MBU2528303.1 HAMP domain-containing protein [bacterium]MBU4122637.1 HAMP domain-containing protein [bacterium]
MKISKVAVKFSIVVSLLLLLIIFFLSSLVLKQKEKSFIMEMELRTRFFGRAVQEAIFPKKDLFQVHFAVNEIMREKGIIYACAWDESGKFISHSISERLNKFAQTAVGKNAVVSKEFLIQEYEEEGESFYDFAFPLQIGDKIIGGIRIGFSKQSMAQALAEVRFQILKIAVFVLALGILVTMLVIGFMVRPINYLAAAAKEIGAGNLKIHVNEKGKDEIGELSRTFNQMVKGLNEREFLRETFGKYVNPEVARLALENKLKFGGERKNVSILISDIRDFTSLSEEVPAEKLIKMLNEYFDKMVAVITERGGSIDKYMGDAILSVFGAPLPLENHPLNAVLSAWEMKTALEKFNLEHDIKFRMGIAVHTGEAIVGNIGSHKKMEYTCIGDPVNTVSRIESLNKEFKTEILLSEDTYSFVSERIIVREISNVKIRGKKKEINIYELKGIKEI